MQIDWWTLGLQAVNALVLIWLLARFLFRPVAAIIARRQAVAAGIVEKAQAARAEAEAEKQRAAAEAEKLAASRGVAMKAVAAEAEAQKAVLIASARTEADRLRAAAEADIARTRAADEEAAAERASDLAVDIAARLLARLPDEALVAGFVDGLADGIAALPADARAGPDAAAGPLTLTAARALSDGELEACREAIAAKLGRPVTLRVAVDPALIAGLELSGPHFQVRNSFRADLDRLENELIRHDERKA